jgi:SNF2 family DNA or RNA helicase
LGDDAGLGKTRTTIMAMDRLGLKRRLVICPAVARLTWPDEIERWSVSRDPVYVIDPATLKSNGPRLQNLFYPGAVTVIVAFDTISAGNRHPMLIELIRRSAWDVAVIDEGHRLANPGSNRTSRIYGPRLDRVKGLTEHAERVWVLTGTPTPNNAGEIYTHARALFPDAIRVVKGAISRPMEHHEFIEKFCRYKDTPYGRVITGSRNQSELRQMLGKHVLRRRKEDVLKELPPLDFVAVPVPASGLAVPAALASQIPPNLTGEALLEFLRTHASQLATLRRELGQTKLNACVEWIIDLLEGGVRKLVVFAHHVDLINELAGRLAEFNPVSITGDTGDKQRRSAIVAFQNNPDTHVLVGQIDACGVAITLTAAHDVAFVECSWVPGANYQAASRCHRLGQRDGVLARMLYVPDSLDQVIMTTFQRKAIEIAQLWD